jgi:hypothetical protein
LHRSDTNPGALSDTDTNPRGNCDARGNSNAVGNPHSNSRGYSDA